MGVGGDLGSKLHWVCNNHTCAGFDGQIHPLGSLDKMCRVLEYV